MGQWLKHGWHVAVAYVIGFFVLLAVLGRQPSPKRVKTADAPIPATRYTALT